MPNYGFVQHGHKWYVTERNRRIGDSFHHAKEAQAKARELTAENAPAPVGAKPGGKRRPGRPRKVQPPQEAAPEVLAELDG